MWQVARRSFAIVTGCSLVLLIVLQLPPVRTPLDGPPESAEEEDTTISTTVTGHTQLTEGRHDERTAVSVTVTTTLEPSAAIRSTCSKNATDRGPGQRVVSFNFYGKKDHARRYFQGIAGNAELVAQLYPGWVMRVYHDMGETGDPDVLSLSAKHPHLDLCDVTSIPGMGSLADKQPNAWRFLPLCDPLVDVFLSRDLDSRVSIRERAAVDEWLISGLSVHVMRDHPAHKVPLLAGMWGARLDTGASRNLRDLCPKLTLTPAGKKGRDQQILWKVLWPRCKRDVMQHDAYSCAKFNKSHGNAHAWPTRRPSTALNFVGSRDGVDKKPMTTKCPQECRPAVHKDWTFC